MRIWLTLVMAMVEYPLAHAPTAEKHLRETMPGGVGMLDYDGDGWADLFFANATGASRLYRNEEGKGWKDVTDGSGLVTDGYTMGVAAGDFDGDGRADLFVTGVGKNWLFRNAGGGKFVKVPFASTGWSISAGWFDYDHDGDLDLFVVNYVVYRPEAEPYCGDQKAGYRTYCHPKHYEPTANSLFRNEGGGRFVDVSKESGIGAHLGKGMGLAFADADRDGWMDVLVTNDAVPNFLFRNNGDGTFAERGMQAGIGLNDDGRALSSMGADFRDVDNDGVPDVFITALANETFPLFRGMGKGLFEDVTYGWKVGAATLALSGWSAGMYDFDNDGRKDLFAANGDVNDNTEVFSNRKSKQRNLLLWNEGKGVMRAELLGEAAQHRGAAFGDLNRDGAIDVVTSRLGEKPEIWMNDRARGKRWLIVETALGAEVEVAGQWNQATQAVGYASSSLPEVHFGLGGLMRVEKVVVRFVGGKTRIMENVGTNQRIRVME